MKLNKLSNLKKALLISSALHFTYIFHVRNSTSERSLRVLNVKPEKPLTFDFRADEYIQNKTFSKLDLLNKLQSQEEISSETVRIFPKKSKEIEENSVASENRLRSIFIEKYANQLYEKYKDQFTPENFKLIYLKSLFEDYFLAIENANMDLLNLESQEQRQKNLDMHMSLLENFSNQFLKRLDKKHSLQEILIQFSHLNKSIKYTKAQAQVGSWLKDSSQGGNCEMKWAILMYFASQTLDSKEHNLYSHPVYLDGVSHIRPVVSNKQGDAFAIESNLSQNTQSQYVGLIPAWQTLDLLVGNLTQKSTNVYGENLKSNSVLSGPVPKQGIGRKSINTKPTNTDGLDFNERSKLAIIEASASQDKLINFNKYGLRGLQISNFDELRGLQFNLSKQIYMYTLSLRGLDEFYEDLEDKTQAHKMIIHTLNMREKSPYSQYAPKYIGQFPLRFSASNFSNIKFFDYRFDNQTIVLSGSISNKALSGFQKFIAKNSLKLLDLSSLRGISRLKAVNFSQIEYPIKTRHLDLINAPFLQISFETFSSINIKHYLAAKPGLERLYIECINSDQIQHVNQVKSSNPDFASIIEILN